MIPLLDYYEDGREIIRRIPVLGIGTEDSRDLVFLLRFTYFQKSFQLRQ